MDGHGRDAESERLVLARRIEFATIAPGETNAVLPLAVPRLCCQSRGDGQIAPPVVRYARFSTAGLCLLTGS